MKLLYGTTNQAKLESMRRVTKILGLEIIGLNDLKNCPEFCNVDFPEIDESGSNPLENAKIKAKAYFNTFGIPVFSCDSGLYFDEVEEQNYFALFNFAFCSCISTFSWLTFSIPTLDVENVLLQQTFHKT